MTMTSTKADARLTQFRVVYALLFLNFAIPVLSYAFFPHLAEKTMSDMNIMLGGQALVHQSHGLWFMLALGNVATLAFCCAYLLHNLKLNYRALWPLAFLKACSASISLVFSFETPAFFAVFVLDAGTTLAMIFFAKRAHEALAFTDDDGRFGIFYPRPSRADARLQKLVALKKLSRVPTREEQKRAIRYNLQRIIFRSENIGTSSDPIRKDAGLFRYRFFRFFALAKEHAITPLDLTGLCASRETIMTHLLAAHHDGEQFLYDLELLECEEQGLDELESRARAIVENTNPKARFYKRLCVYEGYHENLLRGIARYREGQRSSDPELSIFALFEMCMSEASDPLLQKQKA